MSRLNDPGKDKGKREDRRNARLKAWKRPSTKKGRDAGKAERLADWEARR